MKSSFGEGFFCKNLLCNKFVTFCKYETYASFSVYITDMQNWYLIIVLSIVFVSALFASTAATPM